MNISVTDAENLFTKALIAVFFKRKRPTSFLRSFFREEFSDTKEISIAVQRFKEMIAVDVRRGTEGNRNSFDKSTEKIFIPPYWREFFDAVEMEIYDQLYSGNAIDQRILGKFINQVVDKYEVLTDMIDRAYELACAQVLQDGIVQLAGGTNIDFKRKAASKVDLNATTGYWTGVGHDLYKDLSTGGDFLRHEGQCEGNILNAILGVKVLDAMLSNSLFLTRQDLVSMSLDAVAPPQQNAVGATYHGRLTAGTYKVDIWAYNQKYRNANNVLTPYVKEENVIMLPYTTPDFVMAYAAVPRLLNGTKSYVKGKFVFGDYIDERNTAHIFDVKSAGVPVPVAVDQIYTFKAVA